ncbi:hypothetical protein [Streptomyces sp. NPDC054834]
MIVKISASFVADVADAADGGPSPLLLDWIECHGHRMDAVDPPYRAKAHLSGDGVALLEKGVVVAAELPGE